MKYLIPNEIKSSTQLNRWLYGMDLIFILAWMLMSMQFAGLVHHLLTVPYYIFNAAVAFALTRQSPYNPQKKIYQTVLIYASRDSGTYQSVPAESDGLRSITLEDIRDGSKKEKYNS